MGLVQAIFSPSHANNNNVSTNGSNTHNQNNDKSDDNEYYLCNLSLIVATPGCPEQSWHADGGHVSMKNHEACHCFNVFLPLVDIPLSMGPTELRPGVL